MARTRTLHLLFRSWFTISIVCLALMLLHQSVDTTILGRYSLSYAAGLAIMLLATITSGTVWGFGGRILLPLLQKLSTPPLAWTVFGTVLIFIPLFWLFLPVATHLPAIALFRIYIVLCVVAFAMLVLWQSTITLPQPVWTALFIAGILLAMVLTALYIGKVPASLYFDEPLVANYGTTCINRGQVGVDMLPTRDTAYLKLAVPISYCGPGIFMELFGTTLANARIFGIVIIWAAVPFIYLTAKRLFSKNAAIIAALVMLLFPLSHNHLRSDPYVTFVLAVVLYTYIRSRDDDKLYLHFMTGFILATVIEGHQLGVRFIPIFTLFYLWDYLQQIRQQKRWVWHKPFFAYAAGGLLFAGIFYLIHIVWWADTDFAGALALIDVAYDEQLVVGGNVSFWQRVTNNIVHWFLRYVVLQPVEVLLLITGIIGAIWRFDKADRFLLLVFALSFVTYIFITPKPTVYYWVHHLPLVALLAASNTRAFDLPTKPDRTSLLAITPVLVLLVFYTSHVIASGTSTQNADRLMQISFDIDANLPDDLQTITGHQVYFYGLSGRDFYDANTFAKLSVSEAVSQFGIDPPQAIVNSVGLDNHPSLMDYIQQHEMVIARCYTTNFFGGRTQLYILPEFASDIPAQECE